MDKIDRVSNARLEKMLFEAENKSVSEIWEVRDGQPLAERLAKTALGSVFQSEYARRALRTTMLWRDLPGYHTIGQGDEQIVYRRSKSILKVLHNTDHYGSMGVEEIAQKLQIDSDKCRDQLGKIWTPTNYDTKVIRSIGQKVVVAEQPFVSQANFHLSMEHLSADAKVSQAAKTEFAEGLGSLHSSTGLQADVVGVNNTASLDDGTIVVIDTIAVDQRRQQDLDQGSGLMIGELIDQKVDLLRAA